MAVVDYKKEGRIATFTINRPEAMNALNSQVHQELKEAFFDFRDHSDLWVGILTGAGNRAFSGGQDIKEFIGGNVNLRTSAYSLTDKIWKPFIAAINGFALGGGLELALACDLRIAADGARMGQTEVNIGFMPGGGGTQRLPRLITRAKAAEILMMGEIIDAQEAYRIGLVNKVVPLDQLMPMAMQWAENICKKGPLGVSAVKEAIIRGYSLPLDEGLKLELELTDKIRKTEDFREGFSAFVEKKPPVFKGK